MWVSYFRIYELCRFYGSICVPTRRSELFLKARNISTPPTLRRVSPPCHENDRSLRAGARFENHFAQWNRYASRSLYNSSALTPATTHGKRSISNFNQPTSPHRRFPHPHLSHAPAVIFCPCRDTPLPPSR